MYGICIIPDVWLQWHATAWDINAGFNIYSVKYYKQNVSIVIGFIPATEVFELLTFCDQVPMQVMNDHAQI